MTDQPATIRPQALAYLQQLQLGYQAKRLHPAFWVDAAAAVKPQEVVAWLAATPPTTRTISGARMLLIAHYYLHGLPDATQPTQVQIAEAVSQVPGMTCGKNTVASRIYDMGISNRGVTAADSARRAVEDKRYRPCPDRHATINTTKTRLLTILPYEGAVITRLSKAGLDGAAVVSCLNYARSLYDSRMPTLPENLFDAPAELIANRAMQVMRRSYIRGRGQYIRAAR